MEKEAQKKTILDVSTTCILVIAQLDRQYLLGL